MRRSPAPGAGPESRRPGSAHRRRRRQDLKSQDANWYIEFVAGNRTIREATDFTNRDYTNNGRKSLGDLKTTRLPRLDAVFGGTNAIDITTASVERYKTLRLKEKASPATVNRELASLKRMFRLGLRQGMVATMPYIAMLAEHNVRKGFFQLDQFQAILKHLPEECHPLV